MNYPLAMNVCEVPVYFKREPLGGALRDLSESLQVTTSSVYLLWVVESDSCSSHK